MEKKKEKEEVWYRVRKGRRKRREGGREYSFQKQLTETHHTTISSFRLSSFPTQPHSRLASPLIKNEIIKGRRVKKGETGDGKLVFSLGGT